MTTAPYCNVHDVRGELLAQDTVDDAILLTLILRASARMDQIINAHNYFVPVRETRSLPLVPTRILTVYNAYALRFPLLALHGVTINGTALTVGTEVDVFPPMQSPYTQLRLESCRTWYDYASCAETYPVFAEVDATWGWHRSYGSAWSSADTLSAAASATALTLTVNDADGEDQWLLAPRFSRGSIIRVNSEVMFVTSVNAINNTLGVIRARLGTPAAAHAVGSAVSVYRADDAVVRAVARQAAFMYARRGKYEGAVTTEIGTVTFPQDVLPEVKAVLQEVMYGGSYQ